MNLRTELFGKHALGNTLHGMAGLAGVLTLQALCHFLAGALVAAFLMPEGALVVVLGLATVSIMKTLYSFLDKGRVAIWDVWNIGFLMVGGVLCLLYRMMS